MLLLWKNWIDSLSFLTRVSKINLSGMSGFSFLSSQRAQGKWGIHMIIANQSNLHLNTSFTRAPWRGLLRYSDAHSLLLPASNIAPPPLRSDLGRVGFSFSRDSSASTWGIRAWLGHSLQRQVPRDSPSAGGLWLSRENKNCSEPLFKGGKWVPPLFSVPKLTQMGKYFACFGCLWKSGLFS